MFLSYGVCRLLAHAAKNPFEPPSLRKNGNWPIIVFVKSRAFFKDRVVLANFNLRLTDTTADKSPDLA